MFSFFYYFIMIVNLFIYLEPDSPGVCLFVCLFINLLMYGCMYERIYTFFLFVLLLVFFAKQSSILL